MPFSLPADDDTRGGNPKKREAILTAAEQAFMAKGYGISVDEIADAAGVSKQTIYNQFGSKERLFLAIISQRSERLSAPLTDDADTHEPRDVLMKLTRDYLETILAPHSLKLFRAIVAASIGVPKVGRGFYDLAPGRTLKRLTAWIQRQHDKGQLHAPDAALAAEHFASLMWGHIQVRGLLGIPMTLSKEETERRAVYCVDMFLAVHGVPQPRA